MIKLPSISIVIPTYNEEKNIDRCLRSIFNQDYPLNKLEVIVVDDDSIDKTTTIAKKYPVRILRNGHKHGEIGKMIGLKSSTGEFVIYFDADQELVSPDWLKQMCKPLVEDSTLIGSFSKQGAGNNSPAIERFLSFDALQRDGLYQWLSPSVESTILSRQSGYFICKYTSNHIPPAGHCLYRRVQLLKLVKDFDMFLELDFLKLLVLHGFNKFAYVPTAVLYHHHATSLTSLVSKRKYNLTNVYFKHVHNQLYTWINWHNPRDLFKMFLWVIYSNLFIPSLVVGIYKSIKYRDLAGLYEPFVNLLITDTLIIAFVSAKSNPSFIAVGLCLLALVKSVSFSFFGFGLLDEGEMLHNGLKIIAGLLPYRDFFTVFPPLHSYFYAWIFSLFGPSVLAPRLVASIIFAFTPVLIYKLTKNMAPALLLIFLSSNVDRLFIFTPLLLGLFFFKSSKFKSAGLFLGIAALFRLDFSLALLFSMLLSVPSLSILLGFLLPTVSLIIWLVSHDLLPLFIQNTLIDPLLITRIHHLPFPAILNLFPTQFALQNLGLAYTTLFGYTILVIYLLHLFHSHNFFTKTLFVWGLLMLPYLFGRSDLGHLVKGGLPALLLFPNLVVNPKNFKQLLPIVAFVAIFTGGLFESIWWLRFNNVQVAITSNVLRVNSTYLPHTTVPSANTLTAASRFLTASPHEVIALPYMAGLYYLADKLSPTRYDNVLAGYLPTSTAEQHFIQTLKTRPIDRIVYDPANGPQMKANKFPNYNPLVHAYLMTNYTIVHTTPEGWLFMTRKL